MIPSAASSRVPALEAGTRPSIDEYAQHTIVLTILYDEQCTFCRRVEEWLSQQPTHVTVRLMAAGSPEARELYGVIPSLGEDLVVVASTGAVWWGAPDAYLMCLWALQRWRPTAHRLATPRMRPHAERLFRAIALRRDRFSALLSDNECAACAPRHGAA